MAAGLRRLLELMAFSNTTIWCMLNEKGYYIYERYYFFVLKQFFCVYYIVSLCTRDIGDWNAQAHLHGYI